MSVVVVAQEGSIIESSFFIQHLINQSVSQSIPTPQGKLRQTAAYSAIYDVNRAVDPGPDPPGSAFILLPGSVSGSAFNIRIQIQERKTAEKMQRNWL